MLHIINSTSKESNIKFSESVSKESSFPGAKHYSPINVHYVDNSTLLRIYLFLAGKLALIIYLSYQHIIKQIKYFFFILKKSLALCVYNLHLTVYLNFLFESESHLCSSH